MDRKTIAIIAELIPIISAPISFILILLDPSGPVGKLIALTMLLAFLGFTFFFVGRKLARGDRTVRILGILDWLATAYVIAVYIVAIFSFGL